MSTVILLNIDGSIVNVANVAHVEWSEGYKSEVSDTSFPPCLRIWYVGDEDSTVFKDNPASRAAYQWLLSLAVNPILAMGEIERVG